MDAVPYQALPLIQYFVHNIRTGEVRKGGEEPGNKTTCSKIPATSGFHPISLYYIIKSGQTTPYIIIIQSRGTKLEKL